MDVSLTITNRSLLVADPALVTTVIGPVVALSGTVASREPPKGVKEAFSPLKRTAVTFTKLLPSICTDVPGGPLLGLNPLITGGGRSTTVKAVALVADPAGDVTAIGPVVALAGTVASKTPANK